MCQLLGLAALPLLLNQGALCEHAGISVQTLVGSFRGSTPQRCIATAVSACAGGGGRAGLQGGRRAAAGAAAGAADAGRADGGAAAGQPVAGLPQGGLGRGRGRGERAQRRGLSLLRAGRRMAPRLGSASVWAAEPRS